ncbi:VOC family protein [Halegenticoccus tardaugens]|uniref:VOC family protein n=1 Tax=Halegenticoccus tardaugens TaxID=2071624 RepID=UPI00100A4CF4|nr:VOC family protein [Halegenticoccus tardaugens]
MLDALSHLALEVKYLDRARGFYVDRLGLTPTEETDTEVAFSLGGGDRRDDGTTQLILRRPSRVPRGGLHVHYAFSTSEAAYEGWLERLADLDPEEHTFGSYRSLYVDDPDDHCVEIGGLADGGTDVGLVGIFEVVLEVVDLDRSEELYSALGFETVDRGDERRRVRLRSPFGLDLELWEPQLGLADARGGVHVDLAFDAGDPDGAADAIDRWVCERERVGDGVRVSDPDGHSLTFVRASR